MTELPIADADLVELRRELAELGGAATAIDDALPLAALFLEGDMEEAERAVANYVSQALAVIEAGADPRPTVSVIELLDGWLGDEFEEGALSDDVEIVIEEALALSEWGGDHGPDLPTLKDSIQAILAR